MDVSFCFHFVDLQRSRFSIEGNLKRNNFMGITFKVNVLIVIPLGLAFWKVFHLSFYLNV